MKSGRRGRRFGVLAPALVREGTPPHERRGRTSSSSPCHGGLPAARDVDVGAVSLSASLSVPPSPRISLRASLSLSLSFFVAMYDTVIRVIVGYVYARLFYVCWVYDTIMYSGVSLLTQCRAARQAGSRQGRGQTGKQPSDQSGRQQGRRADRQAPHPAGKTERSYDKQSNLTVCEVLQGVQRPTTGRVTKPSEKITYSIQEDHTTSDTLSYGRHVDRIRGNGSTKHGCFLTRCNEDD